MSAGSLLPFPSPGDHRESVDDILYQVNEVIPDSHELLTIPPDTRASDALRLMKERRYSQLPVVQGGRVLGVFSHRSFADGVLELESENRIRAEQLPVLDFIEQLSFSDVRTEVDEILDRLDKDNAVLMGNASNLLAIATPMDVLRYFRRLSSAFLLLKEIERDLRILLRSAFSDEELPLAIARCFSQPQAVSEPPSRVEQLSFGHYLQLIGNKETWEQLQPVFGTRRELVMSKLRPINQLRNDAFHFTRELDDDDHDRLTSVRQWLRLRLNVSPKDGPSLR